MAIDGDKQMWADLIGSGKQKSMNERDHVVLEGKTLSEDWKVEVIIFLTSLLPVMLIP